MPNWNIPCLQRFTDSLKNFKFFTFSVYLKGESEGHNAISKGMKMTFRTKILKKKNVNHIKNATNFILTTFL